MKLRIVHLLLLQFRNASSFLFQSEPEEYGYIGRTS